MRLLIPRLFNGLLAWTVSPIGLLPALILRRLETGNLQARLPAGRLSLFLSPVVARNGVVHDIAECTHPIPCMCSFVIRHLVFCAVHLLGLCVLCLPS
jgi:hypothetical protein